MLSSFSAIKFLSLSALFHLALAAQPRWDSLHRHCQGQLATMGAYGFHAKSEHYCTRIATQLLLVVPHLRRCAHLLHRLREGLLLAACWQLL
jgi:hypothetical protein